LLAFPTSSLALLLEVPQHHATSIIPDPGVRVESSVEATTAANIQHLEILGKIEAHTTRAKHALSLDKLLGEKKVPLDERE
jgi:hypothetical protein